MNHLRRYGRASPEEAASRGFTHALVAPKGNAISYHYDERGAKTHLTRNFKKVGCKIVLVSALLAAAITTTSTAASAHDQWADGSAIPAWIKSACCGPEDVHHLSPEQVHQMDGYWMVDGYNGRIPDAEVLPSQDGDYWIFYKDFEAAAGQSKVYCFFAPLTF